ncbi:glycoside hydrolase family 97 catalytic domain-containing protein [Sorangium sp. So ce119]|uniref:glycoside hydrolase family 97 catalytic domain-containing protein n=1 Tax=Sorangium sp. So ce119 TaxID=3133279 RepID=UPI003F5F1076
MTAGCGDDEHSPPAGTGGGQNAGGGGLGGAGGLGGEGGLGGDGAGGGGGLGGGAGGLGGGGGEPGAEQRVTSPGGEIVVTFDVQDGVPSYSVERAGRAILADSALGLDLGDLGPLGRGVRVAGADRRTEDSTWNPVWGAASEIREHYNELTVHLESDAPARRLDVVFRVFDDGLGLRYVIPEQDGLGELTITSEDTEFRFASDGTTWWTRADFEGDESLYNRGALSTVANANTPMTVQLAEDLYVALHEADLDDYAAMTLEALPGVPHAFRSALVPARSGLESTAVKARVALPFETPWRTLTIGTGAGRLLESHLILNLNDPCAICDGDLSWLRPGKYMGVWWEIHKGLSTWEPGEHVGATTENTQRTMDFAGEHGIPFVLAEGWNQGWDGAWTDMDYTASNDRFDLEEVVAYGAERGVGFVAHIETGANVDGFEAQLDEAFTLYESLGIHAIKTGYVGNIPGYHHYSQRMVNHYAEVARRAAEHQIMVDAHEPIKPTGEERTYPNFMSREGLRGMEYEAWSDGNPASHTLTLPFTRMLGGPVDYNPGIFEVLWAPEKIPESPFAGNPPARVHTTRAHQLALYVILLSGLQMVTDIPEHYEGRPEFAFIEQVPVTWDETRVLNASIGEHMTIARRSDSAWYLGSGTDGTARALRIPLDFLGEGSFVAETYTDDAEADYDTRPELVARSRFLVTSADTLIAAMESSGGQAVRIRPATPDDTASVEDYRPPSYTVESVTVPAQVAQGDFVLVTAEVTNTGNLVGGETIGITVEGTPVDARLVRINADATVTVAFEIQISQLGEVSVAVGDAAPVLVTVVPPVDAPADLRATGTSADTIELAWEPVPEAVAYRVYRHLPGGLYGDAAHAEVDGALTTFSDTGLTANQTYSYIVRAVYADGTESPASNEIVQAATPRTVAVTFRVSAPLETPAMSAIYVPGSIDALGPWNPGLVAMTHTGGGLWQTTVDIPEGTELQYKYARGTWERVEWWGSITGTNNRAVSIPIGSSGQVVDDTSTAWDDGSIPDTQKGIRTWRDPLVAGTAPADGTIVAGSPAIEISFSRDVDPPDAGGYDAAVQVARDGEPVAGAVDEIAPGSLIFTPAEPLAPGAYEVMVSQVKSALGADSVPMQAPYTFGFTVE